MVKDFKPASSKDICNRFLQLIKDGTIDDEDMFQTWESLTALCNIYSIPEYSKVTGLSYPAIDKRKYRKFKKFGVKLISIID